MNNITAGKATYFVIVVFGIIVFLSALFNGFLWDDRWFIVYNPEVQTLNVKKIFGPSMFNSDSYYRPMSALYFTLMHIVFNEHPFFYHIVQIGLHICNAILIFILLKSFFKEKLSLFLAVIFLIHPINAHSVAYIASTESPLFSLFGLLALLLVQKSKFTTKNSVVIASLFFLALLTREEGILFVIMANVFCVIFQKSYAKFLLFISSISVLFYLFIRFVFGTENISSFKDFLIRSSDIVDGKFVPIVHLPLLERLINIPQIILHYLRIFFFPMKLAVDQLWVVSSVSFTDFYFPLTLIIALLSSALLFAIYLFKNNRKLFRVHLFFFVWLLVGLGMHLPFIPLDMTVADHWFYFPIIGILGMLGVGIQVLLSKFEKVKRLFTLIGILIIILLSVRTVVRNTNYHDEVSLFNHDSQVQDNYDIELNLGSDYLQQGNPQEAEAHLLRSVELFPTTNNLYNLGVVYEYANNLQKARDYYLKAFNSPAYSTVPNKHLVNTYFRLAWVLLRFDDPETAEKVSGAGLQFYPDSDTLWYALAMSEYKLNNQIKALSAIEKAISLQPSKEYSDVRTIILNKGPLNLPKP